MIHTNRYVRSELAAMLLTSLFFLQRWLGKRFVGARIVAAMEASLVTVVNRASGFFCKQN